MHCGGRRGHGLSECEKYFLLSVLELCYRVRESTNIHEIGDSVPFIDVQHKISPLNHRYKTRAPTNV